jgi:uncharacterized membrane protein YjfL (UPF0719 family)
LDVSRWKISDSAPVYALVIAVTALGVVIGAVIFLVQALGSLPAMVQWILVVSVVILALFFFYRFVTNDELPQNEEEVRKIK